ncbi:hypothetical protein ABZ753_21580 [Streptomyces griseoincarnatus]
MISEPTREQVRAGIEAQMCPWCGNGPFKILALHTTRLHGVDRFQLRDLAGLTYSTSICAPEVAEERREIVRRSGRVLVSPGRGVKRRLSEAAKETARRKLEAARSDEQRRAATAAAQTPEARAKQAAALRQNWVKRRGGELEHGDYRKYKTGCRCDACKVANAKYQRERRAKKHCLTCGHGRDSHNGKTHVGFCTAEQCDCRRWRTEETTR